MQCPRLDHFVKIIPDEDPFTSVVSNCCVMVDNPNFTSYDEMMQSQWLKDIKRDFSNDIFPKECIRCKEKEEIGLQSDRTYWLDVHNNSNKSKSNYLIASFKLDNICNTACQFCNAETSSKIASLEKRIIKIHEVGDFYDLLPIDRIVQMDFEGGEPSNSKNVKGLLQKLPENVKKVKLYTNGRLFMQELIPLAEQQIHVQIGISLDGTGSVQEYVRWPTRWNEYVEVVQKYKDFMREYPKSVSVNLFTTACAFNVNDLDNIIDFAETSQIPHSISKLSIPNQLDIAYSNKFTIVAKNRMELSSNQYLRTFAKGVAVKQNNDLELARYITNQDRLRNIKIDDYIKI